MAKTLSDLKKAPAPVNTGVVAPPVVAATAAPAPEKKKKKERKYTDEQLQEMRLKNLKPKIKDPAKAEREKVVKGHIQTILSSKPEGATASELRAVIFPDATPETQKALEKEIRFMARAMNCTRKTLENSRRKVYMLPKA